MSEYANLLVEKENGLAIVSINRPKALNALTSAVLDDLNAVCDEIVADGSIKCVILTGAGDKAFVAGADITEMSTMTVVEGRAFGKKGQAVFNKIENLPMPVIAAVGGFALGGGCELCMSCDIRIASQKAKFGQPEVGLGIPPGFGGTQRLPRLVGKGRAKELLFTADIIGADEAYRIGLANAVVAPEELMNAAKAMAAKIMSKAPVAVMVTKACVNEGMDTDLETGCAYEGEAFGLTFGTTDQKEGMGAFVEKRKAAFTGK